MSSRRRRKSGRRRKKRGILQRNPAITAIVVIVIVLCFVLFVDGWRLQKRIDANDAKTSSLQEEITKEKERTKSIESVREAMSTDSAIGQLAKERLGLAESDEVLFRNSENATNK